jgi:hypothetical protein
LKEALTSPLILRLPDFTQQFTIECDASGIGLGAILLQQNQPIVYFSEALKGSALVLSTYKKEMLAIVKAIKKWRPYLLGKPFTVRTDHKSLKYLLDNELLHLHKHAGSQNCLVMITKLSINVGLKIKVLIHYHV